MTSHTLEIPGRVPSYITVSKNASIVFTYDIPTTYVLNGIFISSQAKKWDENW